MNLARLFNQTAVYWPPATQEFDSFGQGQVGVPVELSVRWEEKTIEFLDAQGLVRFSRAVVWMNGDTEIKIGGKLMLGELIDLDSDQQPPEDRVWNVAVIQETPDLKGGRVLRKVLL